MDSTASNTEGPSPESPERKSLVFRVGEELYACDITLVREIVRVAPLTRIPGAPPFVRGLLNVRGDVLTVLDVGVRLGNRPPIQRGSIIVVEVAGRQAGLVVEEVIGVQAVVSDASRAETPADSSGIAHHMGHLTGRIVLYLDVPAFVSQSLV